MGQDVDTETAKEFMAETLAVVDAGELSAICGEVEAKSVWFGETLGRNALAGLTEDGYRGALRRIFSVRGKTRAALEALGAERMRPRIEELLSGALSVDRRIEAFAASLPGVPENVAVDLASELLHFTEPERYWLWTRWMWDPKNRTGALPLVTSAAYELSGDGPGETYLKVGRAVAFVHEVGDAAGFQTIARSIFGTDVYLACVYVVYAYTVLRMRMTREFNKVMPGLPEFCRRLLGVHRGGARADAPEGAR